MADKSPIEWTDATWNPIVGCSIVSPGCTHCYAMKMAGRIEAMAKGGERSEQGSKNPGAKHYAGTTKKVNGNTVWTGKLALAPEKTLLQPLAWRAPRRIFVNSMGDLFHEDVPDEWIDRVFAVMALAPQHTFQVLTKRAKRMRGYFARLEVLALRRREFLTAYRAAGGSAELWLPAWPLPNVWLGVSAERQQEADERIPDLLATPAAVRFVSAEPLLGPIDFRRLRHYNPRGGPWVDALHGLVTRGGYLARSPAECSFNTSTQISPAELPRLDWIIVGGESGPDARPMHPDWARSIRDQCEAAGVAFFFKQWGAWAPDDGPPANGSDRVMDGKAQCAVWSDKQWTFFKNGYEPETGAGEGEWVFRLGKKVCGRLLDEAEHNAMPELREVPAL